MKWFRRAVTIGFLVGAGFLLYNGDWSVMGDTGVLEVQKMSILKITGCCFGAIAATPDM